MRHRVHSELDGDLERRVRDDVVAVELADDWHVEKVDADCAKAAIGYVRTVRFDSSVQACLWYVAGAACRVPYAAGELLNVQKLVNCPARLDVPVKLLARVA